MSGRHEGTVAIVTGANRGIGRAFVEELLEEGATVYAGCRNPDVMPAELVEAGARPVRLDVTDDDQVRAAAERCDDVTMVVNNAGFFANRRLVGDPSMDHARQEMEVNYFGPLRMTKAFAPVLGRNGGGAIGNVLSVAGMTPLAFMGGYSPAKGAALYLSTITRAELGEQGTTVTAMIVGSVDTDMAAHVDGDKEDPRDIARTGLRAITRGVDLVDTDRMAVEARAAVARDAKGYERAMAKLLHVDTIRTAP